jgi:hypothetical protein
MSSRRTYIVLSIACAVILVALLAADAWLFDRRSRYQGEIDRLRSAMTTLERARTEQIVSQERNKLRVAIELLRRQARRERELHLAVTIDSNTMSLERDGAVLREMPIQIGPERRVGIPPDTVRMATPRGARTIAKMMTDQDVWEVPAWVYADRGLPAPADRAIRAGLGPVAVIMDGGTVIYSQPQEGPLADSAYVLPGALRARAEDLRAILPNLKPGQRVYIY